MRRTFPTSSRESSLPLKTRRRPGAPRSRNPVCARESNHVALQKPFVRTRFGVTHMFRAFFQCAAFSLRDAFAEVIGTNEESSEVAKLLNKNGYNVTKDEVLKEASPLKR